MICLSDDILEAEPRPVRRTIDIEELRRIPSKEPQSFVAVCLSVVKDYRFRRLRQEPYLVASFRGLSVTIPVALREPANGADAPPQRRPLLGGDASLLLGVGLSRSWDLRGGVLLGAGTSSQGTLWQGGLSLYPVWSISTNLWVSVGVSGGYLLADSRPGVAPWGLRSSPFGQAELLPFGARVDLFGGVAEFSMRVSFTFSDRYTPEASGAGLSMITVGPWFTYLFQGEQGGS